MPPTIYDLRTDADAARFGLSPGERDELLGQCFPGRNGATPKVICLHTQEGVTRGSLDWWVNGVVNGNPVQASSTVTVQRDGSILRIIPEADGPWTNGDVNSPTRQSAYLRSFGGNPNIWSLTIEAEGRPGDAMPAAQLDAILWQIRDWSGRYSIPLNRDRVIPHASINSVTRAGCPGGYYDRVMAALESGAAPPPSPVYAQGGAVPLIETDAVMGDHAFWWIGRQFHVRTKATPRRYANHTAPATGPELTVGAKVGPGWIVNAAGEDWLVTIYKSRLPMSSLSPRATVDLP